MATNYQRGTYYEKRARQLLEQVGYTVIESRGAHGPFDLIAISALGVRCIQVKSNTARLSSGERESIALITTAPNVTKEYWRIQAHKDPVVEVLL